MDEEIFTIKVINNKFIVEIVKNGNEKLSYEEAQLFFKNFVENLTTTQYEGD